MLSYGAPRLRGQAPPSPASMSTASRQAIPAAPKAARPTPIGLPNSSAPTARAPTDSRRGTHHHDIWLVTGPAGSGKSTIAQHLAAHLNYPYIEGDEFHPKANIDKMAADIPLTDADRWDWLTALREESIRRLSPGPDGDGGPGGVVLTCSALKRKYRDVIRVAPYFHDGVRLHFLYLHAPEEVLLRRVAERRGHYMGANMVQSQFDILEPPAPDEVDVVDVDVSKEVGEVQREALTRVVQTMEAEE